jgi:hypothetical protein
MSDPVVPVIPVVEVRDINVVAEKLVSLAPAYKIRKTESNTFRCVTLSEDEALNWKKGLVYFIARYSKGINLEFWLYDTKGGVGLAQFNDLFRPLAKDGITCEPCGKAVKLRIQLPDADVEEIMITKITGFLAVIEPVATEVRTKIVINVSPKKTAKAKTVAPAPVTEVAPPNPVLPEIPEEPAIPAELTDAPVPAEEVPVQEEKVEVKKPKKNGKK